MCNLASYYSFKVFIQGALPDIYLQVSVIRKADSDTVGKVAQAVTEQAADHLQNAVVILLVLITENVVDMCAILVARTGPAAGDGGEPCARARGESGGWTGPSFPLFKVVLIPSILHSALAGA